jgi:hypothetical protein
MPFMLTEVKTPGWAEAVEACFERGWTDGLPVIPPTETHVQEFVAAARREPHEVLFREATRRRTATVEKVAITSSSAARRPRR